MNAENGTITKNKTSIVFYEIPPYSSVILYASTKYNAANNLLSNLPVTVDRTKEITRVGCIPNCRTPKQPL